VCSARDHDSNWFLRILRLTTLRHLDYPLLLYRWFERGAGASGAARRFLRPGPRRAPATRPRANAMAVPKRRRMANP
jgi:hypothetical protein